ncbi:MAG TPA: gephyrin-like molybdotransferase Glp [Actinomycetota bacterium]|nr:gephyrin-like molybdotransferase Glp [Actinomycetota bacterium]
MTVLVPAQELVDRMLATVSPLLPVALPLRAAAGRVAAEPVRAPSRLPRFTNSAMDGFAVRASDLHGSGPVRLRIAGHAWAGEPWGGSVGEGQAVQIATGAALPLGADTVIPVEAVAVEEGWVVVPAGAPPGAHVRRAGEDVTEQDVVVPAGAVLGPGQVAACAALGIRHVVVHPPARVAIVPTGSEVRAAGDALGPGDIHDAVSPALAMLLGEIGAYACPHPPVPDSAPDIMAALGQAALECDLLLTIGGVSAGERDLVRRLNTVGHIDPFQVALRPAKPFAFGKLFDRPLVGLPGNPGAALIAFEVLARPVILRLQGRPALPRPAVRAVLTEPLEGSPDRLRLVAVQVWRDGQGGLLARPVAHQGAGMVAALAAAQGWAYVAPGAGSRPAGDEIDVALLTEPGCQ